MPDAEPLLSACLIVKDEEDNLLACLKGLNGVVDEVVVYDTGSSDGTVALARRYGARVIEGYWDDDFARARNACLEHCRGRWILHVDADEVFEGDGLLLRGILAVDPPIDAASIEIYNQLGDGDRPGFTHRAVRIFRRRRCHWWGRLHEQVLLRPGFDGAVCVAPLEGMRLLHSGYTDTVVSERQKAERNLRVAEAAVGSVDGGEPGLVELNVARSLAAVGRMEDALEWYGRADRRIEAVAALRMCRMHATEAAVALGRPDEAGVWIGRLREVSERQGVADVLSALAALLEGDAGAALDALGDLDVAVTDDGYSLPGGVVESVRAEALALAGRPEEAADVLLGLVEQLGDAALVAKAAAVLARTGRSLALLAAVLPESGLLRAAAALTLIPGEQADEIAERLVERFGPRPELLAASCRFARDLPVARALLWSSRLRAIGTPVADPLVAQASQHPDPTRRAVAAAAAVAAFADPAAAELLGQAVASVSDDRLVGVSREVAALGAFDAEALASAASTAPRCRLLADMFRDGGAPALADALEQRAQALSAA